MPEIRLSAGHKGYMSGKEGPFRCDNCEYYGDYTCNNKIIIEWARKGLYGLTIHDGVAVVDPKGCSDEFRRK